MRIQRLSLAAMILTALSGCAATPVPVAQPSAVMSVADARHVIDAKKNWTYCYEPSSFSCMHPYAFSSVSVRGRFLQLDSYQLPLSSLGGLGIVSAGSGGTAFLTLQEGINFPMGSGDAGTHAAQQLADALLTMKSSNSDEAVTAASLPPRRKPWMSLLRLLLNILWILAGGLCYTLGTIFYVLKKVPYMHAVWHVFVLAGSILHFIAVCAFVIIGS